MRLVRAICDFFVAFEKTILRIQGRYCETCDNYDVTVESISREAVMIPLGMDSDQLIHLKERDMVTCNKCGQSHEVFSIS